MKSYPADAPECPVGEHFERWTLLVMGVVQGVGFRPFVYRLAVEEGLSGSVCNTIDGVRILVQDRPHRLMRFQQRLHAELPRLARIDSCSVEAERADEPAAGPFSILQSELGSTRAALVTPDAGPCDACLGDMRRSGDRRFGYPLTNCTDCGPRYTILDGLPYDRAKTAMRAFTMCADCLAEYENPGDRRHHAQPNSCWKCGPQLRLVTSDGRELEPPASAIKGAHDRLLGGAILAVKGVGGYHLVADARQDEVVERLRSRKRRPAKPFALLARDLAVVRGLCRLSDADEELLSGPGRPIVLLPARRDRLGISALVAPGLDEFGVMLPSAPLHDLLLSDELPVVIATSANISGHPIVYDDDEAREHLATIVDAFLTHDRPIRAGLDDSVVRSGRGAALGPITVRRARGLAPLPLRGRSDSQVLALGADLKATVALSRGADVFVGEQVGDLLLDDVEGRYERTVQRLMDLLGVRPAVVACDLHPQMAVGRYAEAFSRKLGVPLRRVQHHHAHVAAAMLDRGIEGPVLGIVLDGFGYGLDGTAWGGEFLLGGSTSMLRVGHYRTMRLPGVDRTAVECDRVALAMLVDAMGPERAVEIGAKLDLRPTAELHALTTMCARNVRCVTSSAAGRLFDGAAALIGICQRNTFEAEAPMRLEACADGARASALPYSLEAGSDGMVVDFRPSVRALVERLGEDRAELASAFQATVVEATAAAASAICRQHEIANVVLTGGVFNNLYVRDRLAQQLASRGLRPITHDHLPPGDGCIAAGQAAVVGAQFNS